MSKPPTFLADFAPEPTTIAQATPELLERVYENAQLGLRGDRLAVMCGLWPAQYRQLCGLDPRLELVETLARATDEKSLIQALRARAEVSEDPANQFKMLQFMHGWAPATAENNSSDGLSVLKQLEAARARLLAQQPAAALPMPSQPAPRKRASRTDFVPVVEPPDSVD